MVRKRGQDSSIQRQRASAGPMLKLFPVVIPSDGAKTLPVTSSASVSVTAKVASVSSTTTSFLSPKVENPRLKIVKSFRLG
ncbi:hypothetical protein Goarm_007130 [Gossypium armourianum]|uniref:Uncharacterized protein n=1 Tax=Gossypium armourianum TaxID=34283 RepID=A0A7J9JL53_9ROSI|nr:hypothetical protein [Gossypium armourianum]